MSGSVGPGTAFTSRLFLPVPGSWNTVVGGVRPAMTEKPGGGGAGCLSWWYPQPRDVWSRGPGQQSLTLASLLLHIHSAWAIAALDVGISGADLGGPQE